MTRKPVGEVSAGLVSWMLRHCVALVCSSYQTGHLLFIGAQSDGNPVFSSAQFAGAKGLTAFSQRIYLGSRASIWRLENTLRSNEIVEGRFDRLFVPRNAQVTGNLNVHEIGVEPSGRIIFVNTRHSCLATVSTAHAFKPVWKPAFISKLAPEDRCHLNGLCMSEGQARYVTACSASDIVDGWREHRRDGGILVDVANDRIAAEGLSMPHSPRLHDGFVWLHESGSGHLLRFDPQSGKREAVAFCPGFLRGLAFVEKYAVVALSLPREGRFQGLALDDELARRKAAPWCGLLVIDTRNGDIVEWVRLDGGFAELFDVAVIPSTRSPTGIAPESPELQDALTFEHAYAPLTRSQADAIARRASA